MCKTAATNKLCTHTNTFFLTSFNSFDKLFTRVYDTIWQVFSLTSSPVQKLEMPSFEHAGNNCSCVRPSRKSGQEITQDVTAHSTSKSTASLYRRCRNLNPIIKSLTHNNGTCIDKHNYFFVVKGNVSSRIINARKLVKENCSSYTRASILNISSYKT